MTEKSDQEASQRIRAWIQERTNGQHAVALPSLTTEAVEHFLGDTELVRRLFGEKLRSIVYEIAQRVFKETRPGAVLLGDEIVDQEELAQRASRLKVKWDRWLEHAGETHVRLSAMNRVQLLTAAVERETRADEEFKRASFLRELADRLKGAQTVGQVFKPDEIEAVWSRIHGAQNISKEKAA